jgi:hypothetical protein
MSVRLTFKSIEQMKWIASLLWADLIQSTGELNTEKRLSKKVLFFPESLNWNIGIFA